MNGDDELAPPLEVLLADDDAPDGWTAVAALLRRAGDIGPDGAPAPDLLEALVAAATEEPSRSARRRGGRALALAAVAAVAVLGAGSAAAAAGSLPDPLQAVAHDVAAVVGLDVPDGPPSASGSQDGPGHGRSDEAPGRPSDPGQPAEPGRSDEAPGRPADPGRSGSAPADAGPPPAPPAADPAAGAVPSTLPATPSTPAPSAAPARPVTPSNGGVGAPDDAGRSGEHADTGEGTAEGG